MNIFVLIAISLFQESVQLQHKFSYANYADQDIIERKHYSRFKNCYPGSEWGIIEAEILITIDSCYQGLFKNNEDLYSNVEDLLQNTNVIYENTLGIRFKYIVKIFTPHELPELNHHKFKIQNNNSQL